ncbi:MAG: M28 family peptidase [Solirubrobacteraceae bacterium]
MPREKISLRVLFVALSMQLLAGGVFIWAASTHFSFLGGAGAAVPHDEHHFDARRAFAELKREVAVGPRPAGSPALRSLAASLRGRLPHGRLEPFGGAGLQNVVGSLPGRRPAIVIGAHYDSKDIPGFVGANDGAGGSAAVLELARVLAADHRSAHAPELRFVLFDGEESPAGAPDFYAYGDRGSKAYVARHRREVGTMLLLDFVAQTGLQLPREAGSDPSIWARLRVAARAAGFGAVFPAATRSEILDDHTPFTRAGIPSVDLIDFDYACFHQLCDTPAQLSAASLKAAGESVLGLLRRPPYN